MAALAPPLPPRGRRYDWRPPHGPGPGLWHLHVTAVTVVAAAWLCTLGPVPAILALMTAKHILVALLVAVLQTQPGGADGTAPRQGRHERP